MDEQVTQLLEAKEAESFSVTFEMKHNKKPLSIEVKASSVDELLNRYQSTLNAFEGLAASVTVKKGDASNASDAPKTTKTESKKAVKDETLKWNEIALKWSWRCIAAISHFEKSSPLEVAQQLGVNKPLAVLTPEESSNYVGLLKDALNAAAQNNPGVASYLKMLAVVDGLQTSEAKEWNDKKEKELTHQDWVNVSANDGKLGHAVRKELEKRTAILAAAEAAAQTVIPPKEGGA